MPRKKKHTPEQIISKFRQVEIESANTLRKLVLNVRWASNLEICRHLTQKSGNKFGELDR